MTLHRLPVAAIVAAGLGLGIAADVLLRTDGGPGLNFALLFWMLAASVAAVSATAGVRPGVEARGWLAVGVVFGGLLIWRGSELLNLATFGAAAAAFALPAFRGGRSWVGGARMDEMVEALASSGLHAGLGALRLFRGSGEDVSEQSRAAAWTVVRGLLLAAIPLAVFGALFASADAVFAGLARNVVAVDLSRFAGHAAAVGVVAWLAAGWLAGFVTGTRIDALDPLRRARPRLRAGEAALALGLVDLLFLAFVAVQAGALFGGAAWVERTEGLTYAAYAREGFFQLVAATALGLPWLLGVLGLLDDRPTPARWAVRALAGAQVALLLAIVASAAVRMGAYVDAFGWTEDRMVASAILAWLAGVVLWFGATVLRERPRRFAAGVVAGAYVLVAGLLVLNPAARSARDQLDRWRHPDGGSQAQAADARYLASLDSDAVPILVNRLDELPPDARCIVARRLVDRWGPQRPGNWRAWNRADEAARDAVRGALPRLEAARGPGDRCPG